MHLRQTATTVPIMSVCPFWVCVCVCFPFYSFPLVFFTRPFNPAQWKSNPRATKTIAADPSAGVDWHPTVVKCRCHLYKLYIRVDVDVAVALDVLVGWWCPPKFSPPCPPLINSPLWLYLHGNACVRVCVVCGYQMLARPSREKGPEAETESPKTIDERPSKVGPSAQCAFPFPTFRLWTNDSYWCHKVGDLCHALPEFWAYVLLFLLFRF